MKLKPILRLLLFLSLALHLEIGLSQKKAIDDSLISALQSNNPPKALFWLEKSANPNAVDSNKATALMWAAYHKNLDLFKTLVKKGADPKKKGVIYTDAEKTGYYGNILCIAAANNDTALIQYAITYLSLPVRDKEFNPETGKEDGWEPIHWAAGKGYLNAFYILTDFGAAINATDRTNKTPILIAAEAGFKNIVAELLKIDSIQINISGQDGWTLLHFAARENYDLTTLKLILNGGININCTTQTSITPLMLASYNGNLTPVIFLLSTGADLKLIDKYGRTAYQLAYNNAKYSIAQIIFRWGQGYSAVQTKALLDSLNFMQELNQKGRDCWEKQDLDCALAYCKLDSIYTYNIYGETHPSYATSLNNLAEIYKSMADYKKALPLFLQGLQIWKTDLGENHPSYATLLNNLAGFYENMGVYEKALPLYLQALQIRKTVLGEKHPSYAASLNDLALLYENMGYYEKALPLYLQALQITKTALGENHPSYATSLSNLAGLYESIGDYEKALPIYLQVLQITKTALGENHPDFAASLNNLVY